jgi:hypothetical protein
LFPATLSCIEAAGHPSILPDIAVEVPWHWRSSQTFAMPGRPNLTIENYAVSQNLAALSR